MSTTLEFYPIFRDAMAGRGIRFALTSGPACRSYATLGRLAAMTNSSSPESYRNVIWSEAYYEKLAELLGQEKADWARLPYEERMKQLAEIHASFNTPDDLSLWPAELDGGVDRA
jgi:hypothetical protein